MKKNHEIFIEYYKNEFINVPWSEMGFDWMRFNKKLKQVEKNELFTFKLQLNRAKCKVIKFDRTKFSLSEMDTPSESSATITSVDVKTLIPGGSIYVSFIPGDSKININISTS